MASADLAALRGAHDRAAKAARARLERLGCAAANYRLSGEGVEHICSVKLRDNWRMLVFFPAEHEVAILLVGPHDRENHTADVYTRLYEMLKIDVPDGEHRRPPCCADGQPPVEAGLLDFVMDRTRELARGGQRRRTRRRHPAF